MKKIQISAVAAGLAAAVAFAGGCTRNFQPPVHNLDVTPPRAWTGGPVESARADVDWWSYFGDERLDRAVEGALTRNHDLRAAAARVEAAQAQARIAGADLLPQAEFGLDRTRQRQNFVGLPIPGREGRVLAATFSNAALSFNVGWEADVWGRVKAAKLAATAETQASEADLAGARLSLSGQVAKAWFNAVEAERQADLARATLESYRLSAERVRDRFERGLRPSLDLRLALTEVERAKAQVRQWAEQRDRAIRQLEILLGRYPAGEYAIAEDLPEVPDAVPAGLPSELVHRRPDLLALERQLLASGARIREAKAALRPSFQLTSGAGTTSNRLQDLVNTDFQSWNLVTGLLQPLYQGGRLKANVRLNEARTRELAASYEQAVLQAYREVEAALAAESELGERERALEAAVKHSLAARDEAERRYGAGLTDIITVLSAHRTAFDSEREWLSVRRTRLDNRVDLHLALGGGFSTTMPGLAPASAPGPLSTLPTSEPEGNEDL